MGERSDSEKVSASNRVYSAEDKERESAAIGYKVVGPLQPSDRVFKPYEPVFAVVQVRFPFWIDYFENCELAL